MSGASRQDHVAVVASGQVDSEGPGVCKCDHVERVPRRCDPRDFDERVRSLLLAASHAGGVNS